MSQDDFGVIQGFLGVFGGFLRDSGDYCGFLGYFNDYRNKARAVDSSVTKALMIRPFIAARNGSIFALPQAIPTTIRASEART